MIFLWIFVLLLVVTIFAYLASSPERRFKGKNFIKGPKGLPILGLALDFIHGDPVGRLISRLMCVDVVCHVIVCQWFSIINSPVLVRQSSSNFEFRHIKSECAD